MFAKRTRHVLSSLLSLSAIIPGVARAATPGQAPDIPRTRTPIHHLVVIFQENVSFDHYFATYPIAANPPGEPSFTAMGDTPPVNNLRTAHLLKQNPNTNPANGPDAALPFRLDRTQASTKDQNHAYTAEQMAYDGGKADLFPLHTGRGTPGGVGAFGTRGQVMGYFDGNTVTALWRYARRFALSDNTYTDTYGPSTPGALEVVAGQTNGLQIVRGALNSAIIHDGQGGYTLINDLDPGYDICSSKASQVMLNAKTIGDLLNARGITWGGFMGGFDLTVTDANGTTGCARSTYSTVVSRNVNDYIPHHNWFQYFASSANPTHARPTSTAAIGHTLVPGTSDTDPARHQYDLDDFYATVKAGNFPAVSFVKLPGYQDAHAGYSDPLDEQTGMVALVNFIQTRPEWADTAIIITYDDSDGWYDHAFTKTTRGSFDAKADQLDAPGQCGPQGSAPDGVAGRPVNGRCGPGTRIPLLVLSPWAKTNYIGHDLITQASIVRFIENNWLDGERLGGGAFDATSGDLDGLFDFHRPPNPEILLLDPTTGDVTYNGPPKGPAKHPAPLPHGPSAAPAL
ncbi:phospholipase C [Acidomonas methanolica]|uniref:phospholipase C n=1 Tax=Acidomonas methanolica TaxID=437 RepID=UPI002119CE97|nr:alkaline phosphatase family protein [Acidomonas methanolica]MCQ9156551.1 alkaline phosphatase family protein [Acidomonas methanolica]